MAFDYYDDSSHEDDFPDQSALVGLVVNRVQYKKKREICQGCELTESLALLLPNQDSWQSHRVKYLGAISCCIMQEESSLFLQSMNQKFKKKKRMGGLR